MRIKSRISLIILVFVFTACIQAFSQRRPPWEPFSRETQFSLGPDLAVIFPQGFGAGASFRYEQPLRVIDHLTVLASVGFIAYSSSETYDYGSTSYKSTNNGVFIPFMGGAKYYFPGPTFAGFYGSLEGGFGFGSSHTSTNYTGTGAVVRYPATVDGVVVAPGLGYHNGIFDFSLRYFSVGIVGVRAGYVFKFRR